MKKVYSGPEWVQKEATKKKGWFTFDKQDELCLQMAFKLYLQYDEADQTPELFDELIDEATGLITVFYNAKYNPMTRRTD